MVRTFQLVLSGPRARACIVAFAATMAATAVSAGPAYADAAEDSLALAGEGAAHFQAKRFIEAARAFEQAYRTNAVDPRNLRYAGRAWEEVGVIDRAISLFERYLQVETNPEYRQSIVPRLEELRKIQAKERAEKLAMATIKFPQGQLESEAAQAFARLGDKSSLERAIKLLETSRLWAESADAKARVDDEIGRLRKRIDEIDNPKPTGDPRGSGDPGLGLRKGPEAPASDGLGTALYVVGGAAMVIGGGLGGYGFLAYDGAVKDNEAAKFAKEDEFTAAVDSARTMNRAGIVVAGVGVGVLAWAIVRTVMGDDSKATPPSTDPAAPDATPAAKPSASFELSPRLGPDGAGLAFGVRF